jgi:hypothetical protein
MSNLDEPAKGLDFRHYEISDGRAQVERLDVMTLVCLDPASRHEADLKNAR